MNSAPQCDSQRSDPRGHLVQQLRRQLGHWETDFAELSRATSAENAAAFSSGATAIDQLLPGGGLRHGMLVEWLSAPGGSTITLSLLSAREACREGGELVVIDRGQTFYAPAAAAWGIDLDRLIVVHPRSARDELWAAVESLRSPAVAAVWAAIERLDHRAFRRLQLAAQAGRTLGLLLRPDRARGQPSWADVRLAAGSKEEGAGSRRDERLRMRDERWREVFNPSSFIFHPSSFYRRVQVRVLRMRGGRAGGMAMLEIDDATHTVRKAEKSYQLSAVNHWPNLLADSR